MNYSTKTNISELLKNRTAGNTAGKIVNLKSTDFTSKELAAGYKLRILALVKTIPVCANAALDTPEFYAARRESLNALENIAGYLHTSCGVQEVNMRNEEFRFILDRSRGQLKLSADKKQYSDNVKAEAGIQTLLEVIYWHKLNGIALPKVTLALSTQTKLAKLSEKEAKEAEAEAKKAALKAEAEAAEARIKAEAEAKAAAEAAKNKAA